MALELPDFGEYCTFAYTLPVDTQDRQLDHGVYVGKSGTLLHFRDSDCQFYVSISAIIEFY